MLKKYKDWAKDDLEEVIEWIEEVEAKLRVEATLTTTKCRKENESIEFTFSAIIERKV